jgi:lipoate-protein ligase A
MGISGQPEEMLNIASVKAAGIPVYKRFSGGGTVIVDENTLFITFLIHKGLLDIHPFPEPILRWSADLYQQAWHLPHFRLRENDYCIGEKKCGGNAQYIKKDRWLHHTSFLWDYSEENMNHLLLPAKRPKYRENRSHSDFLTPLKDHAKSMDWLIEELKKSLVKQLYISEFDPTSLNAGTYRESLQRIEL